MKIRVGVRALFGLVAMTLSLASCSAGKESAANFFYEAFCPSCEETQRIEALAARVASWGQASRGVTVVPYELFHGDAGETLDRLCSTYGVNINSLSLPVLFADAELYN